MIGVIIAVIGIGLTTFKAIKRSQKLHDVNGRIYGTIADSD